MSSFLRESIFYYFDLFIYKRVDAQNDAKLKDANFLHQQAGLVTKCKQNINKVSQFHVTVFYKFSDQLHAIAIDQDD